MAMIEQNISGVKLEKLRQKANKKTKFLWKMPKVVFIICFLLSMLKARNIGFFLLIFSGEGVGAGNILAGILMLLGDAILSFGVAALSFAVYLWIFWKKTYNEFNNNYKNKYALIKIREAPGFSDIKYTAKKGISFEELSKVKLLPGRAKGFFVSQDYFEGKYETIRFRSSSVKTYESNNSSLAVFEGQVIVFSSFHEFKISETAVQIFPKKQSSKMKGFTFSEKVETENEVFNNMFSVFAQDKHNAFYILTPEVIEDIMEFFKLLNNNIYIVFYDKYMYIGCEQMKNPFNALVDVAIEEQSKNIVMAADIIQKAKDVLIHIETNKN